MIRLRNIFLLFFFINFSKTYSQKFLNQLKDSVDNAIDLSHFLTKRNGILPILSPVTEPVVG